MKPPNQWPLLTFCDISLPPVLLLHGFLGAGEDWRPVAEALAPQHHVLCPDLPGHGAHAADADYTFDELSTALAALLDHHQIAACAVAGYSLGGRVALHFAVTHPERVSRLVLESTSPGLDDEHVRASRCAHDDALATELESLSDAAAFQDWLRQWYAAPLWETLHHEPDRVETLIAARADARPACLARALRSLSVGRQPSLWHQLDTLTCPVLLIAGGQDHKYIEIAERMIEANPAFAQVPFSGCGHNVHLEAPGAYTTVLKSFLSA